MPAPVTPGHDPRLAQLLERLPALGVPVLPLDYERIARVFAPERQMSWSAACELLVTLLAKDEDQRHVVRREFRRQMPPAIEEEETPIAVDLDAQVSPREAPDTEAAAHRGGRRPPPAATRTGRVVLTPAQRRLPVWPLALGSASLAVIATLLAAWLWFGDQPSPEAAPSATEQREELTPGELPAVPIPHFHDWVPVIEPLRPAAALAAWVPPLALLLGGLLGAAWLWERGRALREPLYNQVAFAPEAESVLTWSPADLRLPGLLSATQRREMVWGVQRFESERATPLLDVSATVRGSAEAGLPELRFARARYEREVWLWLDSRLRTREAVALADQVEHELERAGLRVRRATFPALPDKIRFATRERASPLDLGSAARQALVALFTDGGDIARTLERADSDQAAELLRILRELRTWPRLCLVDFSSAELDLPALTAHLGLACIAPDRLPAWLAERATPRADDAPPRVSNLDLRLWAAACALPHLPVTAVQTRDLYRALQLPRAWRLPAPAAGHTSADGIRFTDGERQRLLADLARWAWEDGPDGETAGGLDTALTFWETRIKDNAASLEQLARATPGAPDWENGGADHEQAIERRLLGLWRGDAHTAHAVRGLWDLYTLCDRNDRDDLQRRKRLIRERLGALGARGLGPAQDDRRIVLPWHWRRLPEVAGEPPGTARERLLRMGFGGAEPAGRKTLGADTRILFGAFAGIALAGVFALGQNIAALDDAAISHDATVFESPLFQSLVTEREQAGRLHAASRKLAAARELLPGEEHLRVHWCWSGLAADQAPKHCRTLLESPDDPRRVNVLRLGDSALLRAGSLAEPIRACAEDWPDLSVAVIAGDPWTWPEEPDSNLAARRLAIRLLDSGAADLALIGPAESNAAEDLARQWDFVENSQWLFFSRLPEKAPGVPVSALGNHRALIHADYAKLAAHLRDRVDGVLDPRDPDETLPPTIARVDILAGNPRLWGGPEVAPGPAGIVFVRICPGTFTMGSHPPPPETGGDDPARPYPGEDPANPVLLDAFEIARTEITRDQLRALRPATVDNRRNEDDAVPVADIDWKDARAACRSIEESTDPDLPTEAQWEYAARAGAQTPWSWGSDAGQAGDYAWYIDNSRYDRSAKPVGEKRPNPLGLHDMHGNVWEWVRDCYDDNAYAGRGPQPKAQPTEDGVGCERRVLRGGSFLNGPWLLRSAVRLRGVPGHRDDFVGFRCVRGSVRQLVD